jgi:hypothetical protein
MPCYFKEWSMHFNRHLITILLLALTACAGDGKREISESNVTSQQVTVQGSAPVTSTGVAQARQAAIDDAIANAAVQMRRNNGSKMLITDIKVVDEWQDGGNYQVQAVAVLSDKQLCASPYRKKLLATAFPIMNAEQISGTESQDLFSGIPREISNRLMESGDFIARNQTNVFLYSRPDLAPEIPANGGLPSATILNMARQNDAQLVLSGVIRDFKIESTDYTRGSGIFAQMKWAMRDVIARRSVGIDVFVHDGFTGALLFQHRYTESILGDVSLPSGYTVGSLRFDSTPAGHAITEIVSQASDDIHKLFGCYPFSARVSQVSGDRITIAAGAQDKIKVGDRMTVYSGGFSHNAGLGFSATLGILTISEVGPSLAAGTIEAGSVVRPGDWVRSLDTP